MICRQKPIQSPNSIETANIQTDKWAVTSETESSASNGLLFDDTDFTSVLSEDDIEYMGTPYNDLTIEQFVQLWAQCTRECNVQRLYVLSDRTDDDNEWMRRLLWLELNGRMLHGYYDVELHQLEDAPDGYYDKKETEEKYYGISYKSKMFEKNDATYEENGYGFILVRKVDGYWKIKIEGAYPKFS